MFLPTFAKPVLYEVPTYLVGCPIGTVNIKTKRKKAMAKKLMNYYKCNKCGVLHPREETKKWIKSYCTKTDQMARLYLFLKRKQNGS